MAPLQPAAFGWLAEFVLFLSIGMAFGAVLEVSGFGDSRKLAAQFYLREMTVLKVMFTGIIVAAVLIALASSLGLLDLKRVWVNPTYLWPGIVGGLIMGIGFIVGGFCPGTSLVAAATLKLDGVAFVLGGLGGVLLFGETVHGFDAWWRSSAMGRFTLDEWLGLPTGATVLLLVLMALGMFVLAELAERRFGGRAGDAGNAAPPSRRARPLTPGRWAAAAIVALAVMTAVMGQPSVEARWNRMAAESGLQLSSRAAYVHPAEVAELRGDLGVVVGILDLRPEAEFNRFHVGGARRVEPGMMEDRAFVRELEARSDNEITFLAGSGEEAATDAWKRLRAQGIVNVYIIEGGINGWLDAYPPSPCVAERLDHVGEGAGDVPGWRFHLSVGEGIPSAHPESMKREPHPDCPAVREALATGNRPAWFDGGGAPRRDYARKVKLERVVAAKGGCG